jgi:DNA-binding beta-propeller fold protein YncE
MLSMSLKGNRCFRYLLLVLFSAILTVIMVSGNTMGFPETELDSPQWIEINEFRGGINLRWFRVQRAAGYLVQRRVGNTGEFQLLSRVTNPVYDDFLTRAGQMYFYRIVPVNSEGTAGPASVERFYEIPQPEPESLEPPVWSTSHVRPDGIALAWDHGNPDHVLAYNLYRKGSDDSTFSLVSSSLDINYLDRNTTRGKTYRYVITALDRKLQESNNSQVRTITFVQEKQPSVTNERLATIKTLEEVVSPTQLINLFTWEKYGFISPVDVDYRAADQRLYVSDAGTGLITVIGSGGEVLQRMGGMGGAPWEFERLLGIGLARDGSVYAVDAYKGEVVVFSPQGGFRMRIRLEPEVVDYFGPDFRVRFPGFRFGLVDLAVGPDDSLFIVDNPNGWIYRLDEKGDLVEVIAERGTEPGQMQYPTFIALTGGRDVFVTDTMNSRVQRFDGAGVSAGVVGEKGFGIGQFIRPKGVAIDGSGFLYVADSYLNVVQVFDTEGEFAALLGNEQGLPIDLGSPNGIVFVLPDTLIICEKLSRRVQIRRVSIDQIHQFPGR